MMSNFFFTDCGNKKNKFDRTKIEINNLINWSKGLRPLFLNGIVSNIHVDGTTVPKKIGKIKIPFEKDEKNNKIIEKYYTLYQPKDFYDNEFTYQKEPIIIK